VPDEPTGSPMTGTRYLIQVNKAVCAGDTIGRFLETDMIKDILVHVPTERRTRPVIDASIPLASTFGAHLDAVATAYVSTSAAYVMDGSGAAAVAAIFEMEQEKAAKRAETALSIFKAEASKAGISCGWRVIADLPAEAAIAIGTAARLYDLSVVLQPDPEHQAIDDVIWTELLLNAGGPALFIPYIFRGAFAAKRIGICWDGSQPAARALRDARPFLAKADTLCAVSIGAADSGAPDASLEKLVAHLGRVGLRVKPVNLPARSGADIQPSLLSFAADESLDMLVMGAYGHSRLREGIFGGVTREMLRTMTIPTLMSH
jgi:nucleotide-binding universal stress UspA family protein